MGGLTAFLTLRRESSEHSKSLHKNIENALDQSLDIIKHHGPDARGQWINDYRHVGKLVFPLNRIYYSHRPRSGPCSSLCYRPKARGKSTLP